jgi:hypothetical protein
MIRIYLHLPLMQGIKQLGSITSATIAVFLFSYAVSLSLSLAATEDYPPSQSSFISKNGRQPVNPDSQFPFEEKDEEPGDEFQNSFSMVCMPADIVSFIFISDQFCFVHHALSADSTTPRVPIYLAKRALII